MNKNNHSLDDFFHIASRILFIVPIVVILVALLTKFSFAPSETKQEQIVTVSPVQPTEVREGSLYTKINLQGPFRCQLISPDASASAFVKEKKMYITVDRKETDQYVLLNGDCVYMWGKTGFSGEKVCGVSSYISLAESLFSLNIISPESLFEQFSSLLPTGEMPDIDMASILNSCKKEEIEDDSLFTIPKNILFKNREVDLEEMMSPK